MVERSLFDVRYAFPGYTFLFFIIAISFNEIIVRVHDHNAGIYAALFAFIYVLSGAPLGFFISQPWYLYYYHFKKGYFYNGLLHRNIKPHIITLKNKVKNLNDVKNENIIEIITDFCLNTCEDKFKHHPYIQKRDDLYHVMGATEASIIFGIIMGFFIKLYVSGVLTNIINLIFLYEMLLFRDKFIIIIGIFLLLLFQIGKKRIRYERDIMYNIFIKENIEKVTGVFENIDILLYDKLEEKSKIDSILKNE